MFGYVHPVYAESLVEFGTPRELPRCGGWILERQIPGFSYCDGMGCYPLFSCQDWSQLHTDLESLKNKLVSLALVVDPFGEFNVVDLHQCFDVVFPFKEHFVADLYRPINEIVSKHHRKYVRKSLRQVEVEICENPNQYLDEWVDLYTTLINRHNIKGIRKFSRKAFKKQLCVPGMVMLRVIFQDVTVGANLFYVQGSVAHAHLSAFSDQGYELGAPYAVKWSAIEYFADNGVHWLNWGGSAGISIKNKDSDGLTQFKKGWTTETRTAYFCGRILDHEKYAQIVEAKRIPNTDYFPAYRKGEFE